ncbi:LLM class flavin-dependent oxidoreductase [Alicyclobacillus fastidiosus]|uniref:LLM class flavin-dependent oxidoreductase n=1 Tax=Alicyclobacillus fastidiosus TaxID=392011 RepID=A0ABV5AKR2_9BACL|nr:LLM class flavin-dependent oxidoreductase [Alicyclobacillus fastidiosus]WEH08322.1 LLM class flavin-dependent oxidoreductase [Alicyclobacillus fastidiosus]
MRDSKKQLGRIPFSVLDLSPIVDGGTATDSFRNTVDLARHAETWGYHRYWLAEHHNMPFIASSATSVVIGHVAANTSTIRVGSGGIMLPNHAPLVIAEQFGTLESLYPGRIDLGLGRAPGTDMRTARALRRDPHNGEDFPEQLAELRTYFAPSHATQQRVRAIPGENLNIPIWLLGSSEFSAQLAGQLGLPFAFASHFSPNYTLSALEMYRNSFQPSHVLDEPYAMVGLNVIAADTDTEARRLATTLQQQFLNLVRNVQLPLQPPVDNMDQLWNPYERQAVEQQLGATIAGSAKTVADKLAAFISRTQVDEIMVIAQIFDHKARLRSYEILADLAEL